MTTPANPHDALFRALVDDPAAAGALLRDHLPAEIATRLADAPPVLEDASFVDDELRATRGDRLYRVALADGRPAYVHVLLEHKSAPDPRTPLQVLGYMLRIWERFAGRDAAKLAALPPIVPLVLYHGRAPWTVPTAVVDALAADDTLKALLRDHRYVLRDLGHMPDTALSSEPVVRAVLLALKHGVGEDAPDAVLVGIVAALPDGSLLEAQVVRYLLSVLRSITRERWRAVAAAAKPGREDDLVSIAAQEWMTQGKAQGVVEGKAIGVAEGLVRAIRRALETRFGPLPAGTMAKVETMAVTDLEALLDRALTAPTLDDVIDTARH